MGKYNFGSGIPTWDGVPMIGGFPMGLTECFFVDYGNGSDGVSVKSNSVNRPWKTLAYAESKITTDKNQGIALMGSEPHTLTEMLTIDKNRMHIFGYDPGGRMYGQNAKIDLGVTTAATDIATILNTGVRNSFNNVKIRNLNTVAEGIYSFVDGGEYLSMNFCEIYKETDMDVTGAADMVMNGDSAQISNSVIGSLATPRSGAVIRACVLMTKGIAGTGLVARDVLFKNCKFWINASNTANRFIYGANATDIERIMEIEKCSFINNGASGFIPAQNVAFGSALTVGVVLIHGCTSVKASTAMSTTTGVFVDGPVPAADTTGIALQAS
jgi:hypothetical protein